MNKKGKLYELLQEKTSSRENQVFNLLLIGYLCSKKLRNNKGKKKKCMDLVLLDKFLMMNDK